MNDDLTDMTNHLEGLLLEIYRWYLEIEDPSQIRFDYEIFREPGIDPDAIEELWELPRPKQFTCDLELSCPSIGKISFGRYDGRKNILEQNASPILVYWKGG